MPYQYFLQRRRVFLLAISVLLWADSTALTAEETTWFDRQTDWHGYRQFHFKVANRDAYIVTPKQPAPGKPWVWRARFPGYHAEMDVTLVGQGYHIAYVDVAGLFGSPHAVKIGDAFYDFVANQRGLASKPALEGVSRGGLFVYNWAAKNPSKVACIYCDTPVCDIKSWPGGKGNGLGSKSAWQQCLKAYGLTDQEAQTYRKNPIDHAGVISASEIPILHIVSENDRVVPPLENTYLLQRRFAEHGHRLDAISVAEGTKKSNGHHFAHPEPARIVEFIIQHSKSANRMELLRNARRIVFLGDSITYAGHYVAEFDEWLLTQELPNPPTVINVGLPSETVSGLTEDGHAGGRFPRPDLAERLERVLGVAKPDLVFGCYGINCAIYQPFDKERFKRYQDGIHNLKVHVEAAGATLVLITPPSFDDERAKKSFSYNSVLDRYSEWLMKQRDDGWYVVDLHDPMVSELAKRRESDSEFTFQPDAVHPNADGHHFMASQLVRWFDPGFELTQGVSDAVSQRLNLRRNAYLSAAGHKRPGIEAGLTIKQAEDRARELAKDIEKLRPPSRSSH